MYSTSVASFSLPTSSISSSCYLPSSFLCLYLSLAYLRSPLLSPPTFVTVFPLVSLSPLVALHFSSFVPLSSSLSLVLPILYSSLSLPSLISSPFLSPSSLWSFFRFLPCYYISFIYPSPNSLSSLLSLLSPSSIYLSLSLCSLPLVFSLLF